jgi:hypothetical protein
MQVTKLKQEVMRIKAETNRKAKQNKADSRGVLEQVSNLQGDLDNSRGGQEQLRMRTRHAEMQRDAAQKREGQIQAEASAMRTKLDIADEEIEKLRCEVCSYGVPWTTKPFWSLANALLACKSCNGLETVCCSFRLSACAWSDTEAMELQHQQQAAQRA